MKYTTLLAPLLVACGSNFTEVYGTDRNFQADDTRDAGAEPDIREPEPDAGSEQAVSSVDKVQALCLSPNSRLDRYVRDSARRFRERLEIPIVFGEGCLPITVEEEIYYKGKPQSGIAHYDSPCIWTECETKAYIAINEASVTTQLEWLPNLLDHEIGHVLSAWGLVAQVAEHLPPGHIMSVSNKRENQWTQEDIDLWCSASPCGKTRMEASWLSPVPAGVTSYLSESSGLDGGVPTDAGPLTDAN